MIRLSSSGYEAVINPLRGGSCVQLRRNGISVLRTPASDADALKSPFFYGTPILFFPNRIAEGKFEFEGRLYEFPVNDPETGCFLHGTLHQTPFEVMEQHADRVELRYQATEREPYLTFPHSFSLRLSWMLTPEGLEQKVVLQNESPLDMPVALGFHTTFQLPFSGMGDAKEITLRLDVAREYSRKGKDHLPDGKYCDTSQDMEALKSGIWHPALQQSSRLFQMGIRKEMVLTDPVDGIRVTYTALQGYNYWMVFNSLSPDWISIEPQSWLTNCPNAPFPRNETGFDFLPPGQSRAYLTRLKIDQRISS